MTLRRGSGVQELSIPAGYHFTDPVAILESGDIVMPHAVFDVLDAEDRGKLVEKERLEARVKGVDAPLDLVRVRLKAAELAQGVSQSLQDRPRA